ncbi:glycosyltransferase family 2 protein [Caproiciproducens sp. R1]|uniref:glycosyltransferase family 2 protein n=1 Tax=Caproiciproducens sp. R1 TaxID=3435000 RepID=UPI0040341478
MSFDSERKVEQPIQVAAVVVTYNRRELLLQCIKKIRTQQNAECDILIVDNASSDGTGKIIQSITDNRLQYRNTGSNLGGAGGFQYGIRWAVEARYDRVWIMDDDTLPESDTLAELLEADARLEGNYGFLSSVVLWTDGHECKMNRQKIKKSFYEHIEFLRDGLIQIEQASFVSLLFPAKTIRKAGLPIKEYFIWGDDIEYTRRIAVRKGLSSYLVGRSQVIHAMKQNSGSNLATDSVERIERYKYAYRNESNIYRHEGLKGFCYYVARCARDLLRIWKDAKDHRFLRSWVLISCSIGGLSFNPPVEHIDK